MHNVRLFVATSAAILASCFVVLPGELHPNDTTFYAEWEHGWPFTFIFREGETNQSCLTVWADIVDFHPQLLLADFLVVSAITVGCVYLFHWGFSRIRFRKQFGLKFVLVALALFCFTVNVLRVNRDKVKAAKAIVAQLNKIDDAKGEISFRYSGRWSFINACFKPFSGSGSDDPQFPASVFPSSMVTQVYLQGKPAIFENSMSLVLQLATSVDLSLDWEALTDARWNQLSKISQVENLTLINHYNSKVCLSNKLTCMRPLRELNMFWIPSDLSCKDIEWRRCSIRAMSLSGHSLTVVEYLDSLESLRYLDVSFDDATGVLVPSDAYDDEIISALSRLQQLRQLAVHCVYDVERVRTVLSQKLPCRLYVNR